MALTSTILLDLPNQTQTLTFFQGPTQLDQITFSNNSITMGSTIGFDLSKSDCLLYNSLFQTWVTALELNFPNVFKSVNSKWPQSLFSVNIVSITGLLRVLYTQTSLGNSIYATDYLIIAQTVIYAARAQIAISLQEFFMMQLMLQQFTNQVSLN
jgi:hypothetical protein